MLEVRASTGLTIMIPVMLIRRKNLELMGQHTNYVIIHYIKSRIKNFSIMTDWLKRITINPDQCGGRPCIRGLRIRVIDILDLLAAGLSHEEILEELPDLEKEDIHAALKYASRKLDHPVIAA